MTTDFLKNEEVRCLLIGRDGNGKSSVVRSIDNAMKRQKRTWKLNVVECESVGDLSEDLSVPMKDVLQRLEQNILLHESGVVAFLFVLKFGVRFTKQEKDAVEAIKLILGEDVFEKWVIIIFTYGDLFDIFNDETERHFLNWCKEQTGDIQKLFLEVKYRIVLFDNKIKDEEVQEEQFGNLLEQIYELVKCESFVPYSMKDFNKADLSRQMLLPKDQRVVPKKCNTNPQKKSSLKYKVGLAMTLVLIFKKTTPFCKIICSFFYMFYFPLNGFLPVYPY